MRSVRDCVRCGIRRLEFFFLICVYLRSSAVPHPLHSHFLFGVQVFPRHRDAEQAEHRVGQVVGPQAVGVDVEADQRPVRRFVLGYAGLPPGDQLLPITSIA